MAVNNINLAVNQRWKTRDGQEVEIIGYDDETNTEYVWDLSPEGSVTDEGYCMSAQSPSVYDIITLIQDEHGFIPWNGGECPVGDGVEVEVKFRAGFTHPARAGDYYWEHKNKQGDIIAYRAVQQEVKPAKVDVEEEQKKEVVVEARTEAKEEPKYTVEQVFEALDKVALFGELQRYMLAVKKTLNKTQDPEYKLYLELKAKFEYHE